MNRQPSSTLENNEKRPEGTIHVGTCAPPALFSSYQGIFCIVFKTQFERALGMFKRKKLMADMTTSYEFPLPATARAVSWPYPIILRRPKRVFPLSGLSRVHWVPLSSTCYLAGWHSMNPEQHLESSHPQDEQKQFHFHKWTTLTST